MKRSRLRPISKKRSALMRQVNKDRDAYRAEFQICQVCGARLAEDLHEIARGSSRAEALKHRECWLAVCRNPCHEWLGDYSRFPITKQLAVKLLSDPKFFDLPKFNRIRGRDENAIELGDVVRHLVLKTL